MTKLTDVYNTHSAAKAAGVHPSTIVDWIRRQGLPATRIGHAWAIDPEELRAFAEAWPKRRAELAAQARREFGNIPVSPKSKPATPPRKTTPRKPDPFAEPELKRNGTRPASCPPSNFCTRCGRDCHPIGTLCFPCLIGKEAT